MGFKGSNEMGKSTFVHELSTLVRNRELSLFLGAGVSISAGLSSWNDLLKTILKKSDLDYNLLKDDLASLAQYYVNCYSSAALGAKIREMLNVNITKQNSILLDRLLALRCKNIWTTNYDKLIETKQANLCGKVTCITEDNQLPNLRNGYNTAVFKIHGDIDFIDDIVITKEDFENFNRPLMLDFLRRDMVIHPFLFVGYSFQDNLILKQLSLIRKIISRAIPSHYAIQVRERDELQRTRQQLFTEDLRLRYNVQTLIVDTYEEIPQIISEIEKESKAKNVFVSGALPPDDDKADEAHSLCEAIAVELLKQNYHIHSGCGQLIGPCLVGHVACVLQHEDGINPDERLRVIPFHAKHDDSKKTAIRNMLIADCGCAIFMYGKKNTDAEPPYCKGMIEEFDMCRKKGVKIAIITTPGYDSDFLAGKRVNNTFIIDSSGNANEIAQQISDFFDLD